MNTIVCPQCHKDYPENYEERYCPYCGAALPEPITPSKIVSTQNPVPAASQPPPKRAGKYWLLFFAVLLAPPLLTMLVAFLGKGQTSEDLSPGIAFFGGIAGGIASGVLLALRVGNTPGFKILLGIVFSAVLAVVCVTLSCFGCLAAGYQMNFH